LGGEVFHDVPDTVQGEGDLLKVVILAGGKGTRISEETDVKPKPMVEIGGQPILWHIMMYYRHFGFRDFVIALGYKGDVIQKYMAGYHAQLNRAEIDLEDDLREKRGAVMSVPTIQLIDTGQNTQTGGRIKRLAPYLNNETFMLTWGDGVSDVNLHQLLAFHRSHGRLATVTAVHPPTRFGRLQLDGAKVIEFNEKPGTSDEWINGAFFVLEPGVFDYISGDDTAFEREPLEGLARDGELMAFKHTSFWQCMDTVHERDALEMLWRSGKAPWKVWN
jgi:glucose-1-phosphate cytidylyltransferase